LTPAALAQKTNLFTLVTVILGASGAIMTLTDHNRLIGAILTGLGVAAVPLHGFLSNLVITVPAATYALALKVYLGLVAVTGAGAIINQWALSYATSLKGEVTLALTVAALLASILAQTFHIAASKAAARSVVAHG